MALLGRTFVFGFLIFCISMILGWEVAASCNRAPLPLNVAALFGLTFFLFSLLYPESNLSNAKGKDSLISSSILCFSN